MSISISLVYACACVCVLAYMHLDVCVCVQAGPTGSTSSTSGASYARSAGSLCLSLRGRPWRAVKAHPGGSLERAEKKNAADPGSAADKVCRAVVRNLKLRHMLKNESRTDDRRKDGTDRQSEDI